MTEITRRNVLISSSALAAVGLLAACSTETESSASDESGASAAPTGQTQPSGPVTIAQVSDVPVGTVFAFTNPSDGVPAYLLQPAAGKFLAYSAVCTHQGCIVNYDSTGMQFMCPCHGAKYDGTSGQPVSGPAPTGLTPISVSVSGDSIIVG